MKPSVWFYHSAKLDGVSIDDGSIEGTMRYLVYIKRKHLELNKDLIMLRYCSQPGLDPSEAITNLLKQNFPTDQVEELITNLMQEKLIKDEDSSLFNFEKMENGVLKLKVTKRG